MTDIGPTPASHTYEEWRVTGDPGPGYGLYSYTWSIRQGARLDSDDPEGAARRFTAMARSLMAWVDGPHLSHCTVTETEWQVIQP